MAGITPQPRLEFVCVVTRHGQRTPASECPKLRPTWPEGFGTLNSTGRTQTFRLGQYIRQRYLAFLGNTLQPHHVKATHNSYPRCQQSIRYILQGFLEPSRLETPLACPKEPDQTFVIERDTKDTQEIFLKGIADNFRRLRTLPSPIEPTETLEQFLTDICKRIGSEKIDSLAMCQALDTLITFRHNNGGVAPDWALEMWNDIVETNKIVFPGIMHGKEAHFSYTLVHKMLDDLRSLSNSQPLRHRMLLFSMSDLNLFSFMKLLNPDFPFNIPFATAIFFEVFQDQKGRLIQVQYYPDKSKQPYKIPLGVLSNPCRIEKFIEELERIRVGDI